MSRFLADERGATAIEYGLLVALVALAIITAFSAMAGKTQAAYQTLNDEVGSRL